MISGLILTVLSMIRLVSPTNGSFNSHPSRPQPWSRRVPRFPRSKGLLRSWKAPLAQLFVVEIAGAVGVVVVVVVVVGVVGVVVVVAVVVVVVIVVVVVVVGSSRSRGRSRSRSRSRSSRSSRISRSRSSRPKKHPGPRPLFWHGFRSELL